jgi:hypothetical protein
MKFADLHLHTVFSDSTYTPQALVREAKRNDLSCISVVDHDTVLAIEETQEAASGLNIEVVPGIELSTEYDSQEVHILGYFIDYKHKGLIERLDHLKKNRIERIYKIVDKLKGLGKELRPEAVFALAKIGTVGRMHVARAMVREGLAASVFEAFKKYIGDKCPAYVLGFKFAPQDAIRLIKDAGGIPVLAHPYTFNRDELIPQLAKDGIMGLEVYYSGHTQSMVNFYLGLAEKFNLLVTGGSDCHGEAKPEVKIGSVKIPYELVEKLKAARQKLG